MIFQRDEKGLLHQLDITLDKLPEGTQTNLLVVQHMYVIFTEAEQKAFDEQRKAAHDKLLAEARAAEEATALKQEARARDVAKLNEIDKARKQAEAAKDAALALALEQLAELKQKVSEIEKR